MVHRGCQLTEGPKRPMGSGVNNGNQEQDGTTGDKITANHRPQFHALREQLRTAQIQLGNLLYNANPVTPDTLSPLATQIGQLRDQLAQERLQVALEIRGVSTPDQLAKAAQVRQQLSQLRMQMRTLLNPGP